MHNKKVRYIKIFNVKMSKIYFSRIGPNEFITIFEK